MKRYILNYAGLLFVGTLVVLNAKDLVKEDKNDHQRLEKVALSQALTTIEQTEKRHSSECAVEKIVCEVDFENKQKKVTTYLSEYRKKPTKEIKELAISDALIKGTDLEAVRVVVAANDKNNVFVVSKTPNKRIEREVSRQSLRV